MDLLFTDPEMKIIATTKKTLRDLSLVRNKTTTTKYDISMREKDQNTRAHTHAKRD